jgi:hypothetical protein
MLFFPEGADEPDHAPRVADAPAERPVAKVDPAVYDAYVGEYEIAPGFILAVTREGDRLMTQATGQPKVEIFAESETNFFIKVVDAQVIFDLDAAGRVTGLTLFQGGQKLPGKKIK